MEVGWYAREARSRSMFPWSPDRTAPWWRVVRRYCFDALSAGGFGGWFVVMVEGSTEVGQSVGEKEEVPSPNTAPEEEQQGRYAFLGLVRPDCCSVGVCHDPA